MSLELSQPKTAVEPCLLTAKQMAAAIESRSLSCEELIRSCLSRISDREPLIRAWLATDPEHSLRQAREFDKRRPRTALHGIPWGVKDVFNTEHFPTTYNSAIYQRSRPGSDAACVAVVRACGAVILGKTDTVEFAANGRKALTRNPHNPDHSPGGSSSGSAAAVADFHVPLAFGSQTVGSLIRPASYNGIYAFKPSWGVVSSEGMKQNAISLDTVGWYARELDDLNLVANQFNLPQAPEAPKLSELRVGICRSPVWQGIEPSGATALFGAAKAISSTGVHVAEVSLPPLFDHLHEALQDIYHWEGGRSFLPEMLALPHLLAPALKGQVENERNTSPARLIEAYEIAARCRVAFEKLFDAWDVLLTPSSPGEAPLGIENTGSSIFNGIWTMLAAPCISIPAGKGQAGLPIGVTLVGRRFGDRQLLDIASELAIMIDA